MWTAKFSRPNCKFGRTGKCMCRCAKLRGEKKITGTTTKLNTKERTKEKWLLKVKKVEGKFH